MFSPSQSVRFTGKMTRVLIVTLLLISFLSWAREANAEPDIRIMFVVFPSSVQQFNHAKRVYAATDTWAKGEQVAFVEPLNLTFSANRNDGTRIWDFTGIEGTHQGEQGYREMFQRSLKEDGWDWLMRVDDYSVVFPSNLRRMLKDFSPSRPLIFGSKLVLPGANKMYFSGGPGWVISRAAVEMYMKNWCPAPNVWYRTQNYDIAMHDCMVRRLGFHAESPRDPDGGSVFAAYGPVKSFKGKYDTWFKNYKKAAREEVREGKACCAEYPVSFHYVEAQEQRNIYSIMTEPQKWEAMSATDRLATWNRGDFSPYSTKITASDSEQVWDLLLHKLRADNKTA